jgi:hypothetical protein
MTTLPYRKVRSLFQTQVLNMSGALIPERETRRIWLQIGVD